MDTAQLIQALITECETIGTAAFHVRQKVNALQANIQNLETQIAANVTNIDSLNALLVQAKDKLAITRQNLQEVAAL